MSLHNDHRESARKVAERTALMLILVILLLAGIALALAFRLGEALWPAWLATYRTQFIGFDLLALLVTVCAAPVIVEANSRPRHLSGPGHNPYMGPPPG